MRNKIIIIVLIVLAITLAGASYWYFMMGPKVDTTSDTDTPTSNGFVPINRGTSGNNIPINNDIGNTNTGTTTTNNNNLTPNQIAKVPTLRMLSNVPVGGFGASTTASTTVFRWIDRGRGNIYESKGDTETVTTLSNTIVPRIYDSFWNKNLTALIISSFQEGDSDMSLIYADIKAQASSTVRQVNLATSTSGNTESITPFELKGKKLPENIIASAVSPKKDQLFMLINENSRGIGYISTFDGKNVTKIFDTPLTQVNVEWPEDNTLAITTKGNASQSGYLYFVNPKSGVWTRIAGPLLGLSAKVSHDAKYVLISSVGNNQNLTTEILSIAKNNKTDAVIRTLADKCVWGNFYKNIVYCAVPTKIPGANLPDDWYKGTVSFIDKVWQVNAGTGEIHLVSSLLDQADRIIDAYNLGLDPKDDYLLFINKNDLSLWSLDLVASN